MENDVTYIYLYTKILCLEEISLEVRNYVNEERKILM